jgi:hypothetical protein
MAERFSGVPTTAVAAGFENGDGGAMSGVKVEPGAGVSDVGMMAEATPLCGDAAGGVCRVSVVEILAVLGATANELPERNALTYCDLAVVKPVREWVVVTGG